MATVWCGVRHGVFPKASGITHSDDIQWKHFPRYWTFVRGIHRSPVNSPCKGQWRGAFSLICAWINGWVNNHETGYLRRHRAYYDVIVMKCQWAYCESAHERPSRGTIRVPNSRFHGYIYILHSYMYIYIWCINIVSTSRFHDCKKGNFFTNLRAKKG